MGPQPKLARWQRIKTRWATSVWRRGYSTGPEYERPSLEPDNGYD